MSDFYLVTTEAPDGSWADDPESFNTQADALSYISLFRSALLPGNVLALYNCVHLQAYDGDSALAQPLSQEGTGASDEGR